MKYLHTICSKTYGIDNFKGMKQFLIQAIFFLLIFYSCSNPESIPQKTCIVMDLDQAPQTDTLKFSQLFSQAHIIPLDTSSSSLMGNIQRLAIAEGNIFAVDKFVAQTVFMFDEKGNFIRTIGSKGSGKGEYINPQDIAFDKDKKRIFVLDSYTPRVFEYDYVSGNHISTFQIPTRAYYLLYYQNAFYTDCPKHPSKAVIHKTVINGKHSEYLLSRDIHNKGWKFALANQDGIFLRTMSNTPLVTHLFMDTVFCISKESIYPYIVIRSENMMQPEDIKNVDMDKNITSVSELHRKEKYYNLQTYLENDSILFFQLQKGKGYNLRPFIYNKKNKTTQSYGMLYEDMLFKTVDYRMTRLRFGCADSLGVYFYFSPDRAPESNKLKEKLPICEGEDFNGAVIYYEFKK